MGSDEVDESAAADHLALEALGGCTHAQKLLFIPSAEGADEPSPRREAYRLAAILLWFNVVLGAFTIDAPLATTVGALFTTDFTVGNVSVSLGDLLTFGLTLFAFLLAVLLWRLLLAFFSIAAVSCLWCLR